MVIYCSWRWCDTCRKFAFVLADRDIIMDMGLYAKYTSTVFIYSHSDYIWYKLKLFILLAMKWTFGYDNHPLLSPKFSNGREPNGDLLFNLLAIVLIIYGSRGACMVRKWRYLFRLKRLDWDTNCCVYCFCSTVAEALKF